MHILYLIVFVAANMESMTLAAITVSKVIVRVPRENDIGLIFDLYVVNTQTDKKEMLEFQVRSDGTCCVNLTNNRMMSNASRIVGGNFGYIEAGATQTVSLIWPTVSLYNRVGSCPVIITSTNAKGEEVHIKQILHFDTRFTTLDPEGHTLRKHKDYLDCNNWDLEYLKNCTPVDCEERYFGRRSFYNCSSQRCDAVPPCSQPHEMYDMFANECIDTQNFCTEEDMAAIRQGKFDDNVLDLKCGVSSGGPNIVVNEFHNELHGDEQHDGPKSVVTRNSEADPTRPEVESVLPYWLKGLIDGLLIVGVIIFLQVFATIAIYVLICFAIFLIVSWISRQNFKTGPNANCNMSSSGTSVPLYTHSSLLSQR